MAAKNHIVTFFFFTGILFAIVCLNPKLRAQVILKPDTIQIGQISVLGNNKTKTDVIIRELEFHSGDWVNRQKLELAQKRIENLNIFNRVIFNFSGTGEQKDLIIIVWERWYLYPLPIFSVNEHDFKKLSYGMGVFHANFRGRAENLFLTGWLGYNPGLSLSYSNSWFGGKHRLYLSMALQSQKIASKTLIFPEQTEYHRSFSLVFGKRHGLHWYTDAGFNLDFISADKRLLWQQHTGKDKVFSVMLRIQRDTRDLWEYPRTGRRVALSLSKYFLLNQTASFNKLQLDWREYRTLLGITLAGRFLGETSDNLLPVYERTFVGYDERIRGHFNEIYEGESRLLGSVEMRVPLLRETFLQIPLDNWFMSYFQQMKFGIYLTLFRDSGAVWYQKQKLVPGLWNSGSGVGLNFILPYSNILRLEYGFNEEGRSEFIIDVNTAF